MSRRLWILALGALTGAIVLALIARTTHPRKVRALGDATCTTTLTPATGASEIASAIVSAASGSTVCLASGSYPLIGVMGATHSAYVTVRPAPGATATVAGMEVSNSAFLRFQGLHMTAGFNMRDGTTYAGSHDYQFIENTIENTAYGIVLHGGAGPIRKVLIEGNHMRNLDFVGDGCNGGYAGGQGVTLYYADGVTIADNTFKEVSLHYIQGSGGREGVLVEHNLFEGPIQVARVPCTHLNVWQIWNGGENDTFTGNIVRGEPGKPAAVTPLLFETGAGGAECAATMTNTTVTNNLFIDSASAYVADILTTKNLVFSHNTVVGGEYGTWIDRNDNNCGAGTNLTAERNIAVKTESSGSPQRFVAGECTGVCAWEYNVSDDGSAEAMGSRNYKLDWAPAWTTTTWNPETEPTAPAGYYKPTGLSFTAGYEGTVGPS